MIVVAGSLNIDLVGRVPRLPVWGETLMGDSFASHHGGKGGNQAVAAARLGAPVAMAAAVGQDGFGAELRRALAEEGLDLGHLVQQPGASGCALIHLGPDGANAISVLPGANRQAPLPPTPWPTAWRLLVLQLEIPLPTVQAWAQAARQAGATVLLNAAPMPEAGATALAELLPLVDLLVLNEGELQALRGAATDDLDALARRGPSTVVVTLGARGCKAWHQGQRLSLPGRAVEVVDTTGAGDTFVGALACGLWQGLPMAAALQRANAAAALSCTQPGARGGMPRLAQLDAWLQASAAP